MKGNTMAARDFSAAVRPSPDGGYSVQAYEYRISGDAVESEVVLDWVHCDTYDEAISRVAREAAARGFAWDDIEWAENS